jgi:hypothetical protein
MRVAHDGAFAVFAPPVADERAITDHRDHEFCRRRTAVVPSFDDEEIAALDTELLQIRSRGAIHNLALVDGVCGNRQRLARNPSINRQTLRTSPAS